MKRLLMLALGACLVAPALAQTSFGVSIGIHQPGVYGRVTLGDYPQPVFIHPQPVLVAPQPYYVRQQPVYLYVPPTHRQRWAYHCGRYQACGQPVHFVREDWIRARWEDHRHHGHPGRGDWNERGRRHDWDRRDGDRRDWDRRGHGGRD